MSKFIIPFIIVAKSEETTNYDVENTNTYGMVVKGSKCSLNQSN